LVGGLPHGDWTLPCIGRRGRGSEKRPQPGHTCVADRLSLFRLSSLSCQSFGPQPFQIFAQRFLLLLVFGQGPIRWTEYVVGVIFLFAHDVTLSNCRVPARLSQIGIAIWDEQLDRKRPRLGAGGLDRSRPATALRMGASRADQPQVKIGLGGRATRAIRCPPLLARRRLERLNFRRMPAIDHPNVSLTRLIAGCCPFLTLTQCVRPASLIGTVAAFDTRPSRRSVSAIFTSIALCDKRRPVDVRYAPLAIDGASR
jgi:hypothetical protein